MKEIIKYFLKLGSLGFGGPFVLIASMQRDLIEEKAWISKEKFNAVLPLIKSMPGPIAFQMAVYLARERAGTLAGVAAGVAIIFPAFLMVLCFAAFERFVNVDLRGLQIAALAVVFATCGNLIRGFEKQFQFWIFVIASFVLTWIYPQAEALWIVGLGLVYTVKWKSKAMFAFFPWLHDADRLAQTFWVSFKAGAFTFGSGLAIIPLLEHDFVTKLHWLQHADFMNGLAIGQVTPGPVSITATYLGFKVAGFMGSLVATIGIFSASIFNMVTWFPKMVNRISSHHRITLFSRGALAAAVGAIGASCFKIGVQLQPNNIEIVFVFTIFALALFQKRIPIWALVIVPGVLHLILTNSVH